MTISLGHYDSNNDNKDYELAVSDSNGKLNKRK